MQNKADLIQNKIVSKDTLLHRLNGWRVKSNKIVFTNGCFDILHKGHIALLLEAASEGNKLIVGINTDNSVRRLKGAGRPVNKEQDRALLLAAQAYVDAVVLFDEDTPYELISAIMPDVLVKGGDYAAEAIVGAGLVTGNGGQVVIVPMVSGYSTTGIINKLS
jgi:D-beta-D-heptose 7-phosphate kinase/D-beta-D-heptose 1-phosphate adenosyltransferase